MELSKISTEDLLNELKNRKEDVIANAIININNYIRIINDFGVRIEHEDESIKLLPNFKIKKHANGEINMVTYKDEEY